MWVLGLGYTDLAADAIARVLGSGNVVLPESTSPVDTTERIAARLAGLRPDPPFPRRAIRSRSMRILRIVPRGCCPGG